MEIDESYLNRVARNKNLRRIFADNVYSVILRTNCIVPTFNIIPNTGFDAGVIMTQEPQHDISLMVVLIAGSRYEPIDIFYSKSIESYSVGFLCI